MDSIEELRAVVEPETEIYKATKSKIIQLLINLDDDDKACLISAVLLKIYDDVMKGNQDILSGSR